MRRPSRWPSRTRGLEPIPPLFVSAGRLSAVPRRTRPPSVCPSAPSRSESTRCTRRHARDVSSSGVAQRCKQGSSSRHLLNEDCGASRSRACGRYSSRRPLPSLGTESGRRWKRLGLRLWQTSELFTKSLLLRTKLFKTTLKFLPSAEVRRQITVGGCAQDRRHLLGAPLVHPPAVVERQPLVNEAA
jgi:hypothetical protein